MPVLPPEPAIFPEDLLQNGGFSWTPRRRWHVMHTRPRQEKSVARELRRASVPFYLPLISRRGRLRGRAITSYIPLFPGYVSVFADNEEWSEAVATGRIVRLLRVPDQPQFWNELRQIYQLIASGAPITPEDQLAVGDRIVIRSGPLAGLEGVIYRTASGRRFAVQVDFIQRGASVLLDDADIAAVSS